MTAQERDAHSAETEALLEGKAEEKCCTGRCCATSCCLLVLLLGLFTILYLKWQRVCLGPAFHDDDVDALRPAAALQAEAQRRAHAPPLLAERDLPVVRGLAANAAMGSLYYEDMNFVQGFERPGCWSVVAETFAKWFGKEEPQWKPPVEGEKMGILTFQEYSKKHFGKELGGEFLEEHYTGGRVPSWEDNVGHTWGVKKLTAVVKAARAVGVEPISFTHPVDPRVAFDHRALAKMASDGFRYYGPMEIKYASNGFYGASLVERKMQNRPRHDLLAMLMTDSVFGAHLWREGAGGFSVDLRHLGRYRPLQGYAALGGRAVFEVQGAQLRTVLIEYNGTNYTDFNVPEVDEAYERNNTRKGWRMAEGAFIATLLSMTNLVMHVKDLHVETSASLQAVTVDAFANRPKHPVRRLLDAFISRSVQATNDNLRLLFDFHAADFSLAPLPHDEQLRLIDDAIQEKPLNLAEMDLEHYGELRGMDAEFSTAEAVANETTWGWRWHYRALTVQRLLQSYVQCFLTAEGLDEALDEDSYLKDWWQSMIFHLPSLRRATQLNPEWASEELTMSQLARVLSTLMVWVSWIHEDVGHAAAAYVWNPVYTPMCVPEDGVGVPLMSWLFNALAYRGFVFLHRSTLLDEAPNFWFNGNQESRKCFGSFQDALRELGQSDPAFSECEKNGFYTCVDRVETAVSS